MKIKIDGKEYRAPTAVALIDEIKGINWSATPETDAEGYIAIQADTLKRLWNKKLILPESDTETRAIAMFKAIASVGAWEFETEE